MLTQQHIEEVLSRAYVQAVAGRAGINVHLPSLDYGIDGVFRDVKYVNKRRVETGRGLDFQLKASINWTIKDENILYDLEVKTYNDFINRVSTPGVVNQFILILFCLPNNNPKEWLLITEEELLLKKCAYWCKISGSLSENKSSTRIVIPRSNLLTPKVLTKFFATIAKGKKL